jgi:hypothetical protein
MNKYQMIAFGGLVVVGLSYAVANTYSVSVLGAAVIFTLIVAILTLRTTWWLFLGLVEITCKVAAAIGHIIGIIGDEIVDWCRGRKAQLRDTNVPSWDDLASDQSSPDEPVQPSFLDDAMARQS